MSHRHPSAVCRRHGRGCVGGSFVVGVVGVLVRVVVGVVVVVVGVVFGVVGVVVVKMLLYYFAYVVGPSCSRSSSASLSRYAWVECGVPFQC